jgi:PKD repeat protein
VNAIYYAADHGAKIISMSLGAAISSDAATDAAILYAYNAGVTTLAATGNENKSTISYPAINANVIGVGAASPCGDRKRSSSLSSECNPGVSTDPRGYTCDGERWWGSNYGTTTANAESGSGWDRYSGYGMVDMQAAVGGGGCTPLVTANFSGTPTSGVAPLTVNFSDLSTGSPTSWSWNFGDGGTSTARNPSHAYTTVGSYNVTLTATNACGSDAEVKNAYITVTAPGGWTTITYDTFETGLGSYSDGGSDMSRYTGGTYAYQGVAAADIQDNSGTASAFTHTLTYNVSAYTTQEITFYFRAQSMETGDDFWVRYYNGSAWQTVATYVAGTGFVNGTFYSATVTLTKGPYTFPTNARLRFQCDAGDNNDDVYIDAITWRGSTGTFAARGSGGLVAISTDKGAQGARQATAFEPLATSLDQNCPNPFKPRTAISFSLVEAGSVRLEVFDVSGKRVASLVNEVRSAGRHTVLFDASALSSGSYFYRLIADGVVEQKKMVLLK